MEPAFILKFYHVFPLGEVFISDVKDHFCSFHQDIVTVQTALTWPLPKNYSFNRISISMNGIMYYTYVRIFRRGILIFVLRGEGASQEKSKNFEEGVFEYWF